MVSTSSVLSVWRFTTVALFVIFICCTNVLATPAEDAFTQGKNLLQKNDFKGAIIVEDKAINLDPKCADAYNIRGLAKSMLGQYQKAIDDCSKAIQLDPKYAWAYFNRRHAYDNLRKYQKAIDDYSKAIELDPKYADAYHNIGISYYKLGKTDLANKDLQKAKELGYTPNR